MPSEYKQLGRHVTASMAFIQNIRLHKEAGYFDTASELKPLLHLWSLSIEEQFYLVFPLLLWIAWRARFNVVLVISTLALLSFLLNVASLPKDATGAFFLPQMRFWELISGSLLASITVIHNPIQKAISSNHTGPLRHIRPFFARTIIQKPFANIQPLIGFLLIIAPLFLYQRSTPFPGWSASAPVIGSLLVIQSGSTAWLNRSVLGSPIMVSIGLISYPLYLWHWPILVFCKIEWGENIMTSLRIMALVMSLILSGMTYWYIERRIKRFGRIGNIAVFLFFLGLSTALLGMTISSLKGMRFRFPNLIADLQKDRYTYPDEWRGGTCGLDKNHDFKDFAPDCFSYSQAKNKSFGPDKTLLLWGDSYAAQLYPGLKAFVSTDYLISQLTTAGCPPVIGYVNIERRNCKRMNDEILDYLSKTKHDEVLLAGNWDYSNISGLPVTIDTIKNTGQENIIMVGPPPRWDNGLPRSLFKIYLSAPDQPLPDRLAEGFSPVTVELDKRLNRLAKEKGIRYVSAYHALCNQKGCKSLHGDSIISFDMGHLSVAGSNFMISSIREQILP
jgi:peptidoglycan/LPS O-acetylase OafA/YrhL